MPFLRLTNLVRLPFALALLLMVETYWALTFRPLALRSSAISEGELPGWAASASRIA